MLLWSAPKCSCSGHWGGLQELRAGLFRITVHGFWGLLFLLNCSRALLADPSILFVNMDQKWLALRRLAFGQHLTTRTS